MVLMVALPFRFQQFHQFPPHTLSLSDTPKIPHSHPLSSDQLSSNLNSLKPSLKLKLSSHSLLSSFFLLIFFFSLPHHRDPSRPVLHTADPPSHAADPSHPVVHPTAHPTSIQAYRGLFFTVQSVFLQQPNRVEIIANDQGNRTTPSYVAFTDTESLIGDMAKNQVAMNPTNTVFSERLRVFLFFIFYFWVYVLGSEFVLLLFLFKTHLDLNFI